jgi:hypothetical protein
MIFKLILLVNSALCITNQQKVHVLTQLWKDSNWEPSFVSEQTKVPRKHVMEVLQEVSQISKIPSWVHEEITVFVDEGGKYLDESELVKRIERGKLGQTLFEPTGDALRRIADKWLTFCANPVKNFPAVCKATEDGHWELSHNQTRGLVLDLIYELSVLASGSAEESEFHSPENDGEVDVDLECILPDEETKEEGEVDARNKKRVGENKSSGRNVRRRDGITHEAKKNKLRMIFRNNLDADPKTEADKLGALVSTAISAREWILRPFTQPQWFVDNLREMLRLDLSVREIVKRIRTRGTLQGDITRAVRSWSHVISKQMTDAWTIEDGPGGKKFCKLTDKVIRSVLGQTTS